MIYAPPPARNKADWKRINSMRQLRKEGTGIENFLFFHNKNRRLTMATHDIEGVYDKYKLVEDFDLLEMCVYMTSLEIYVTEVVTLREANKDEHYQIIYDGKIVCAIPVAEMIKKYSFQKVMTEAAKLYFSEKD